MFELSNAFCASRIAFFDIDRTNWRQDLFI